ncbi:MAG: fatty acid desaturase family protein [Pararhodobacter sp.]
MNHAEFLSSLSAETRAALPLCSDRAGLLHPVGHAGAIAVVSALILSRGPGWWLLLPVQGVLIVFLFTLEHECTHRTPFASDRLSGAVGHLTGALVVNPFWWFRFFHLAHHRFTNVAGDPELDSRKPETRAQWLWHVSGLPLWGASLRLLRRLARGHEHPACLPDRQRPRAEAEARALIALCLAALASLSWSDAVLWLWLVPILLGQPALRLCLLAEHGDCPRTAEIFTNTRTTLTTRLVRFIAWNMPWHTEHHVHPGVPFHRLPRLHRLMRGYLRVTAPGHVALTRDDLARRP